MYLARWLWEISSLSPTASPTHSSPPQHLPAPYPCCRARGRRPTSLSAGVRIGSGALHNHLAQSRHAMADESADLGAQLAALLGRRVQVTVSLAQSGMLDPHDGQRGAWALHTENVAAWQPLIHVQTPPAPPLQRTRLPPIYLRSTGIMALPCSGSSTYTRFKRRTTASSRCPRSRASRR